MATRVRKKRTIDVTETGKAVSTIVRAFPASFIPPPETDEATIETPDSITEDFDLEDAPGGMVDTVEFSEPGAFIFGKYKGVRTLNIGTRSQTLHDLEVDGTIRAMWGSTILDQRIMRLNPQIDEWIYIQYCGEVDTKRGLNPAKNFRVARMKPKANPINR